MDIHATLVWMLEKMVGHNVTENHKRGGYGKDETYKGKSMLVPISPNKPRSCLEAGVQMQFCRCIKWYDFRLKMYDRSLHIHMQFTAMSAINTINQVTKNYFKNINVTNPCMPMGNRIVTIFTAGVKPNATACFVQFNTGPEYWWEVEAFSWSCDKVHQTLQVSIRGCNISD
jgi:hypothetical protein